MSTYFKAVRPDGTDFYSGTVDWARPGEIVRHPVTKRGGLVGAYRADAYLSVATVPTECTGMDWPCRLFAVTPVRGHQVVVPAPIVLPHKRASTAWRVVREVPAHVALGPQGEAVAAIIARCAALTANEARRLDAAWGAARGAVWGDARDAVWVRDAAPHGLPQRTLRGLPQEASHGAL